MGVRWHKSFLWWSQDTPEQFDERHGANARVTSAKRNFSRARYRLLYTVPTLLAVKIAQSASLLSKWGPSRRNDIARLPLRDKVTINATPLTGDAVSTPSSGGVMIIGPRWHVCGTNEDAGAETHLKKRLMTSVCVARLARAVRAV